jgi:hypothetical protein
MIRAWLRRRPPAPEPPAPAPLTVAESLDGAPFCHHCQQPVEKCPAVIIKGHRMAGCKGHVHTGGWHACPGQGGDL